MPKSVFVCQTCGFKSFKWLGRCPECGEWESLVEEVVEKKKTSASHGGGAKAVTLDQVPSEQAPRVPTGSAGLDRVLGGGMVPGSLVLLGGEPGVGKSTLMLQVAKSFCEKGKVLYVSGEESPSQIKLRAERLGLALRNFHLLCEPDIRAGIEAVEALEPGLMIFDSIQTLYLPDLSSIPGSVSQVRELGNLIMRTAKTKGIPAFLTGHVTKEGAIAGPKTLEHLVDVVVYFEGEGTLPYRILRGYKNRFGAAWELAFFEMESDGLKEVTSPSSLFLSHDTEALPGVAVAGLHEGSTPLLAEIQALCVATPFASPRRTAVGFDYNRLCLLLAILQKHCGADFAHFDVYLSVAGGLPVREPGADLAAAAALLSSFKGKPLPLKTLFIGELGLTGTVRGVIQLPARLKEAFRMGFEKAYIPPQDVKEKTDLKIERLSSVQELKRTLFDR
jgi:DNA repair protein RadA/Sms